MMPKIYGNIRFFGSQRNRFGAIIGRIFAWNPVHRATPPCKPVDETGEQSSAAIVLSTLSIAALFNPLHKCIRSFIDRRFYRSKYDSEKTLLAFSQVLREEVDLDELNERLVAVVNETLQPERVGLWIRNKTRI